MLVGQPKCGTTDLYDKIHIHPQVIGATQKEIEWWGVRRLCKYVFLVFFGGGVKIIQGFLIFYSVYSIKVILYSVLLQHSLFCIVMAL